MGEDMNKKVMILISIIILLSSTLYAMNVKGDSTPPTITLLNPSDDSPISSSRPMITISYEDDSDINQKEILLLVDDVDVTDWDGTEINNDQITHIPPEIFSWDDGNHSVEVTVTDSEGNKATQSWTFVVDSTIQEEEEAGIDIINLLKWIVIITIIIFACLAAYILFLKKTKGFTFEKFFAQHPIQKEFIVLYIPLILGFLFTIFSLSYSFDNDEMDVFATEYILVLGFFIAIAPYAIDSQLEKRNTIRYERAFSQLLFEIADAMRGGLDPTKAIIELSKSDTSILKKQLKIAADNIKLGRPFDEIMLSISKPIKSELVKKYSSLIGTTAKIGGEPAQVIHRAAKDMDDFIKVSQERRRQLTTQATTMYVAFGVLLIVLYQLITLFPSLGSINIELLSGAGTSNLEQSASADAIQRMSFTTIKKRFFDLIIINSIGTGTIIGSFVEGHFKFGLLHSIVLTLVSVLFFAILIL